MAEFLTIGTVDELQPGDEPIVVEINRRWIAVYNVDGTYCAIEDRCTHDDGPLAEGPITGKVVTCPRHGAQFDVCSGKVLAAPAYSDVPVYEVRVVGNEIQVGGKKEV